MTSEGMKKILEVRPYRPLVIHVPGPGMPILELHSPDAILIDDETQTAVIVTKHDAVLYIRIAMIALIEWMDQQQPDPITPNKLRQTFSRRPFQPFSISTNNRRPLSIHQPHDMAIAPSGQFAIVAAEDEYHQPTFIRVEIASITRIDML